MYVFNDTVRYENQDWLTIAYNMKTGSVLLVSAEYEANDPPEMKWVSNDLLEKENNE